MPSRDPAKTYINWPILELELEKAVDALLAKGWRPVTGRMLGDSEFCAIGALLSHNPGLFSALPHDVRGAISAGWDSDRLYFYSSPTAHSLGERLARKYSPVPSSYWRPDED